MLSRATRPIRSVAILFVLSASIASSPAAQSTGPLQFVSQGQLTVPGTTSFGKSLVLSGDDLVTRSAGQQHVFHRTSGTWSLQATFAEQEGFFALGPNETADAIGGDVLLIGIPFSISGRVQLFERTGGTFGAPTTLMSPVPGDHAYYGHATLVHAGLAFIGMPDFFGPNVQIRRETPTGWKIVGSVGGGTGAQRGSVLRIAGSRLLVGEQFGVNLFTQGATPLQWTFEVHLAAPNGSTLSSCSIDGNVVVLSHGSTNGVPAFVYEHDGFAWAQSAALFGHDALPSERIRAVLVHGSTIYVGLAEVVYVFQRLASGWTETAKILPVPALPAGTFFGQRLATDGTTLFVGASAPGPGTIELFDIVPLPAPQTYCTAKVNSQGCLPVIGASGIAGVTNTAPFVVGASNVLNEKTGLLIYTTAGAASTPFQGGTLCIAAPFQRTPAQQSGGSTAPANDCSGTYAFDFNARIQSGVDPALAPGAQVWAQYYSRDPADPFQVGLSDAIAFTIGS